MSLLNKVKSIFNDNKRVDVAARFEILRQAVSGTMSQFNKAHDRKTDRIVGLKVLDKEKTIAFEQRFKSLSKPKEGEIAIKFKHPRIVETYEHGMTTKGEQYLVMEFLDGPGLQMLITHRESRLVGKRVELFRQMAEAIDVVHKAGYIHRDICPRNFICSPELDSLKLIDFGLTLPATRDFMQPGNRTGTPLYMAPEVLRRRWTDHRVDIFSLGVTAYHLMTFDLPWPVGDATGMDALSHDTQPPTDIFELQPKLNRTLGELIMQCMEVKPDKRPETAERIVRTLGKVKSEMEP